MHMCGDFLDLLRYILASIINKHHIILTKRLYVATAVPYGTQRHHWSIGVPGYTLTTFLVLCSPGDYR